MVDVNKLQNGNSKLFVEKLKNQGVKLDFSIDSLKIIDDWLDKGRAKIQEYEKYDTIVLCGAYLGEVLKKYFGGKWATTLEHGLQPIVLDINGANLNPLGKVKKFLDSGKGDSLYSLAKAVEKLRQENKL